MVCSVAVSQETGSFNIENIISGILSDPGCASLALPLLLTAEQRKHAKAVVARYPDLKCESFGMGKDRQMHVFKCKPGENSASGARTPDCSPHSVNVKNTFIDDWIDASPTADNRIVQSMPHNMFGQCLAEEFAAAAESKNATSESEEKAIAPSLWVEETVIEEQLFDLGTEVIIDGLVKAPSFNGAVGVVQSWDHETGRYNVLLSAPTSTGHQWAKLKAENLQLHR